MEKPLETKVSYHRETKNIVKKYFESLDDTLCCCNLSYLLPAVILYDIFFTCYSKPMNHSNYTICVTRKMCPYITEENTTSHVTKIDTHTHKDTHTDTQMIKK